MSGLNTVTIKNYQRNLAEFIVLLKQKKINNCCDLDSHHLRLLVKELNQKGIKSPLYALRSFLSYLVQFEHLTHNPAKGGAAPKLEKPLPKKYLSRKYSSCLVLMKKST